MEVKKRSRTSILTPKDIRDEELSTIASKVASDVLKLHEDGGEEEEIDNIDDFEEELDLEAKDRSEKNAFIIGDMLESKNIPYEYKISKDHEHKCFWSKPLNEDILANEFGGGNFTVALYKTNPKRFMKQTTLRIGEPQRKVPEAPVVKDNTETLMKMFDERSKAQELLMKDREIRMEKEAQRLREELKDERERDRQDRQRESEKRNSEDNKGKSGMLEMLEVVAKLMKNYMK
jgi:hypothetical protein